MRGELIARIYHNTLLLLIQLRVIEFPRTDGGIWPKKKAPVTPILASTQVFINIVSRFTFSSRLKKLMQLFRANAVKFAYHECVREGCGFSLVDRVSFRETKISKCVWNRRNASSKYVECFNEGNFSRVTRIERWTKSIFHSEIDRNPSKFFTDNERIL